MRTQEAFPSRWVVAGDVVEPLVVTIRGLSQEEIGQDRELKPVLWFTEIEKGLILNKTNWQNCAKLCGSEDSDGWVDKQIELYSTEVQFRGEEVMAVRVRPVRVQQQSPRRQQDAAAGTASSMTTTVGTIQDIKRSSDGKRLGIQIEADDGVQTWTAVENKFLKEEVEKIVADQGTGMRRKFELSKRPDGKCALLGMCAADKVDDDLPF